jgi:hypothetical protein
LSATYCPNATLWRSSCKRRTCPACGPRWARDWYRCLLENLRAYGGPVVMVSVTPPGAPALPWDEEFCSQRRVTERHEHAGKRGCRVRLGHARQWNETASLRWGMLRRAAMVATRRRLGHVPTLLERVWEVQRRGVVHLHLVLGYASADEREASAVFVEKLHELAPEYGFGNVDRGKWNRAKKRWELKPLTGAEAARYCASYLTGRSAHKPVMRELVHESALSHMNEATKGRRLPFVWVTPRLTRRTFVTIRTLRRARHVWAAAQGFCPMPKWGSTTEALKVGDVYARLIRRRGPPIAGVSELDVELARTIDKGSWGGILDAIPVAFKTGIAAGATAAVAA